jgi:hypothetical protein
MEAAASEKGVAAIKTATPEKIHLVKSNVKS